MNAIFESTKTYSDLLGRLLLAAIFITAGYGKIGGYVRRRATWKPWAFPARCCRW